MAFITLAFLTSFFSMLMMAFFSRPIFGLYAYLIAFYAHPISRWWGQSIPDLRWSLLAAIATFLAVLIKTQKHKVVWFKYRENKLFLLFLLFLFLQYFWALNSNIHQLYVTLAAKYLILIFLIQNCLQSKNDVIGFIICNMIGGLYFSYLSASYGGGRLGGIGGPGIESSNGLGQHLAITIVFVSYLLFVNLGRFKILMVIPILVLLNTLMLTESRGALLAILLTGCVSIFYIPKKYKKQFVFLLSLGALAFMVLLGPQIVERFGGINKGYDGEIQDKSAASRLVIIEAQYEMFKTAPMLGQGHRGTLQLSRIYVPAEYSEGNGGVKASHNFLMGMLVDHGIVGSAIYLLIIYFCLKRLKYLKNWQKEVNESKDINDLQIILTGCCLALFCFMVAGLFSNNKIFEIAIWLIAIIPLIHNKLEDLRSGEKC